MDVTNEKNGKTVRVKINDRGPFVAGRILDLSKAAAQEIASVGDGVVPVTLRVVTLGDNFRVRAGSDEPPPVTAANTARVPSPARSPCGRLRAPCRPVRSATRRTRSACATASPRATRTPTSRNTAG